MTITVTQLEDDPLFLVDITPPFIAADRELESLLRDLRCWVGRYEGFGYVILNVGEEMLTFSGLLHALGDLPEEDRRFLRTNMQITVVGSETVLTLAADAGKYLPMLGGASAASTVEKATALARQQMRVPEVRVPQRTAS